MKTNQISFGITYIKPNLALMSKDNRKKLEHSYGLGQINPNDIYLGANKNGDLTLDVTRSNPYDYLAINMLIEPTPENVADYKFYKACDKLKTYLRGPSYPVEKYVIKNLKEKPKEIIAFEIQDKIDEYNHIHIKSFES